MRPERPNVFDDYRAALIQKGLDWYAANPGMAYQPDVLPEYRRGPKSIHAAVQPGRSIAKPRSKGSKPVVTDDSKMRKGKYPERSKRGWMTVARSS